MNNDCADAVDDSGLGLTYYTERSAVALLHGFGVEEAT
jgi:hypothetical protein